MKFKSSLIALRIAITSRRPYVTLSYWRNRKAMSGRLDIEPAGIYCSKSCQLQRVSMSAHRGKAVKKRLLNKNLDRRILDDLPEITICMVTYNSEDWLEDWFEALSKSSYPHEKIFLSIVDNASMDKTSEVTLRLMDKYNFSSHARYFRSESNLGFGAGQDIAIKNANSKFVLVINPDAILSSSSILDAVKFAISDEPDICAWEFAQIPFEHPKYYDPVTLETSWNSHACVLVLKSAYEITGGYDKSLFMYGEDVDLSYKFRLAGFRLRYLPWIRVNHDSSLAHGKRTEQSFRIIAANLCLRRRYGGLFDKLVGYLMLMRIMLSSKPEIRALAKKAWVIYRNNRLKFGSLKHRGIYFPFNGFEYDRYRPTSGQILGELIENSPKVSVITRVHENTEILGQALLSVMNQTYDNIEHIVVFDNCTPFLVSDQITIQQNFKTRAEAANVGAKNATGDLLLFLDYDDLLFADHIEGLVLALKNFPKAVCAYGVSWEALTDNRQLGVDDYMGLQVHMEAVFEHSNLKSHNPFAIQSVLIKNSAFIKVGGFNSNLDKLEDWDLWKRLVVIGDFTPYLKVTSIFYTPNNLFIRFKRSLDLSV